MSASQRSSYFDNAKFILIYLVVLGHLISPFKSQDNFLFTLYTVIFLFHMPAFILISGYFSKGYKKKGHLLKSFKKILVPYFIFQSIYSIYYYCTGEESKLTFNYLEPHWTLWFLLSLFFCNLLLHLFARFRWAGLAAASVIGIGIGYWDDAGSYLSLSRTFVFFPYFLLGHLLEPQHLQKIRNIPHGSVIGIFILSAALLAAGFSFPKDAVPWLLGDTSYAGMGAEHWFDGLIRLGQYGLTIIVILGFFLLIPSKGYKWTNIGERTLYVYLLHGFIIKTMEVFASDNVLEWLAGNYLLLIAVPLGICLFLGSYYIRKFTKPIIELRF
ncbi:putative membrane-bound acyltransferase YkrP [Weizmannia acidilactici]|uniref:acyltransferase family protein n=1 Tax=Weizmannia acidilactici TaxID=2607726 RepID=UPI00124ECBAF|nr:acyltransferase family protein [Weizmannia acidilactici]GER65842.1 putative membrane-bound acyltransferase YkrP [Weizmannia acidilactici]